MILKEGDSRSGPLSANFPRKKIQLKGAGGLHQLDYI